MVVEVLLQMVELAYRVRPVEAAAELAVQPAEPQFMVSRVMQAAPLGRRLIVQVAVEARVQ